MMVDPNNRLVADTLEADWNERLRALANVRDQCERSRAEDQIVIDAALRDRLAAMTKDFQALWRDPAIPNRERKRMLAHVIEDATLVKIPEDGIVKIHVRFRGGHTNTLTTQNPQPSWKKVKTPAEIVELVDRLLDDHFYEEIADILNAQGLRPGGSAWPGRDDEQFTSKRVQYIVSSYRLRLRVDRLRARGLLTKAQLAKSLGIHVTTVTHWVQNGLIKAHAYNHHAWLYEQPPARLVKHSGRWDRLVDRAEALRESTHKTQDANI